ncbi:MAG: VTT domain-containing protein [bacterium]|nr:VTT domain-containing protein [bacterium]
MSSFLFYFINDAVGSTIFLSLVIVLCASILEDLTAIIVGVLAADGIVPVSIAFFSLYAGIMLGDVGLYWLGRLARTHPRLARFVEHDFVASLRAWLEGRYVLTVFSARFIPGSRLPTYTASGFFHFPFSTFALTAVGAVAIWTTFLFTVSYWFGSFTSGWLVHARWGIAAAFLLIILVIGRHNFLAYRARKNGSDTPLV